MREYRYRHIKVKNNGIVISIMASKESNARKALKALVRLNELPYMELIEPTLTK
jgi:hypothetical protein